MSEMNGNTNQVKTMWNTVANRFRTMTPRARACAAAGLGLGFMWLGSLNNGQPALAALQPGSDAMPGFGNAGVGPGFDAAGFGSEQVLPGADPAAQYAAGPAFTPRTQSGQAGMAMQQGRYFRYPVPAGWTASETANGVTLTAPDGRTGASSVLLINYGLAQHTPASFLSQVGPGLGRALPSFQASGLRPIANSQLPTAEADISFVAQGGPVVGSVRVSVWNDMGRSIGTFVFGFAPSAEWPQVREFLQGLADRIEITNAAQVAGQDTLIRPRNNPNTALDGIIASGEYKNRSGDYTSQRQSEATLGYETMQDSRGYQHDMPNEAYDPTIGGYQDPYGPRGETMTRPPEYTPPQYPR